MNIQSKIKKEVKETGINSVEFVEELIEESERSVVITSLAKIESTLAEIFKNCLFGSKSFKKDILEFNGPLGTLSSRIKMLYALKLVDKNIYLTLEKLRELRNEFAHKIEAKSLSIQKYSDKINSKFDKNIYAINYTYQILKKYNDNRKDDEKFTEEMLQFLSVLSAILLTLETCKIFYSKYPFNVDVTFSFDMLENT